MFLFSFQVIYLPVNTGANSSISMRSLHWQFPHHLLEVLLEEANEQLVDLQQKNLIITIRNLASVPSGKQREWWRCRKRGRLS